MDVAEAEAKKRLMPQLMDLMEVISDEMIATAQEHRRHELKKYYSPRNHPSKRRPPNTMCGIHNGESTVDIQREAPRDGSPANGELVSPPSVEEYPEMRISSVLQEEYPDSDLPPNLRSPFRRNKHL